MTKTIFFAAIIASTSAFGGQWEQCAEAHADNCQGSGCLNARAQTVFQACGAPPRATGAEKYRILGEIADSCAAHGTTDFGWMVKNRKFSNAMTNALWFVSPKDAREACAGK